MTVKENKYLYLETLGCQMNVSDSDKIISLLRPVGYVPVQDPAKADLIILNTCSVRAKAEQKVYNHLSEFKGLKRKRPSLLIGVGGCVAQQEGKRLLENVPHLNLVFGTHNLHLLPDMVRMAERGERTTETEFIDNETRLDLIPFEGETPGIARFVTVMQGCDNYCSYCVVPYVRGREISRRSSDIVHEISVMADKGVKEVTLLGQNVNSYGQKSSGEIDFVTLLHKVAAITGIERIRFTTSHPKDFSLSLIDCFANITKLCSHIHLPAQAGSNTVLAMMNRGYTREMYLDIITALKNVRPGIQITGDIIVGFPGESESDFQQTLALMEEVSYADVFSFSYSPRPGTKAAEYPENPGREEKQQRLTRLLSLQRQITLENNRKLLGSSQTILVEGKSRRGGQLFGRTTGNRVVNFSGEATLIGSFINVDIVRADQNSLLGEISRQH
jgi:tRNA-2-methylthio-N6-dimethylallyladenosine synthase